MLRWRVTPRDRGPVASPDFADLQSDVNNLAGVDITDPETERLLNQANVEICTRSGWTKDLLSLGPTVADQELYALPANFRQLGDDVVFVGNGKYRASDYAAVRDAKRGSGLVCDGLWYMGHESGVRKLGLYPISAGQAIEAVAVITPDLMVEDDDEPPIPMDFREALVHWVRATALGFSEDDQDGLGAGFQVFQNEVARLTGLRIEVENGDGPLQVQF